MSKQNNLVIDLFCKTNFPLVFLSHREYSNFFCIQQAKLPPQNPNDC